METLIVIMLKNKESGFLEKELQTIEIEEHTENLLNIFAVDEEDGKRYLHIKLTTENEVKDWEYSAIYDYYDRDCFENIVDFSDEEDDYNPVWEVTVNYSEEPEENRRVIKDILSRHYAQLTAVYDIIKDKEDEYVDKI
ncbi:MAG: hypothetical protein IJS61_06760 [Firmicutes bacterium]|nr:hypothetical protein [Bacillota bacterium]